MAMFALLQRQRLHCTKKKVKTNSYNETSIYYEKCTLKKKMCILKQVFLRQGSTHDGAREHRNHLGENKQQLLAKRELSLGKQESRREKPKITLH